MIMLLRRRAVCIFFFVFGILCLESSKAQHIGEFKVTNQGLWPSVALDNSGNAHIMWSNEGIVYGVYDSTGHSVRESLKIFTATLPPRSKLSFLNDRLLVVWNSRTIAFNSYIYGRLISKSGELIGSSVRLNDEYFDAERGGQQVSRLTDTSYIVVWAGNGPQTPSPANGIYGQIVNRSLEPIQKNFFISAEDSSNQTNIYPDVSSDKQADSFIAVWLERNSRPNKLVGRLFNKNGTAVSNRFTIAGDDGRSYLWSPSVVMGPDGGFWIAWSASQDSVWNVFLCRYKRDGSPDGVIKKVNTIPANYASEVRMGIDDDEDIFLAWESIENGKSKIMIQRITPQGLLAGENLVVSQTDTNSQIFPELSFWNNRACIVWQSGGCVLAKFMNTGETTVGTIANEISSQRFILHPNYPNPFNPSTTIQYTIPKRAYIKVMVYDVLGKEVKTLEEGTKEAGLYSTIFDATNLQSGVYFYRLITAGYTETKKMILLK